MRVVTVFLVLVVALVSDAYDSDLDGVDMDALITDDRRLAELVDCLLDNADDRCSHNAKILKDHVQEILSTNCAKCNEKQHQSVGKLFQALTLRHPQELQRFLMKYDPAGESMRKYGDTWRKV